MSRIYEIFGTNAHAMTRALMESAGAACKIPSGASVALKPNLVVAASPETGATTHAGVLSGAIEYLRDHGFRDISIIEGSWVGDDTGRAFRAAGYEAVGKKYGVPLFDLKRDKTRRVDTPLRPMDICCRALDADYLINLPVLKGHCQTAMTCALKNCKGCLPDREKRRFHTEGLMRPIAALAAALRPELTIVDSLCGDLDFEEGGNPVPTGRMLLGEDPVQLDAYGCRLMGLALEQVPYIQMAEAWGAGSTRLEEGDVVRLNEPSAAADYPAPPAPWPPSPAPSRPGAPARPATQAWCAPSTPAAYKAYPSPSARAGAEFPLTALESVPAATAPKSASQAARPRQRTSCASSPPAAEPHGECAPDFPPKSGAFLRAGGEPPPNPVFTPAPFSRTIEVISRPARRGAPLWIFCNVSWIPHPMPFSPWIGMASSPISTSRPR
ncbi:MAG: DUF362 domain-containing protein [Flavonifractor plautii]